MAIFDIIWLLKISAYSSMDSPDNVLVAQWIEHFFAEEEVVGSSPI